ncbi:MAG: fibronectin type III domain-containing protein, partial [Hominilimicola sp.]
TDTITTLDVPGAPTLIGGNSYNNQIIVTWTAPASNGGSNITEYKVYAEPVDGSDTVTWSGLPTADTNGEITATISENLVTNQKYNITVTAVNAVGEGAASASTRVQVVGTIVQTKPSEPTNVKAAAGDASVVLTWGAPINDGNSTITGYSIWAGNSESDMGVIAKVDGYTFAYTDTGLKNGVGRFYKIKAINGVDADGGPFSAIVSATPKKIEAPTAPTWPAFDNENGVSAYETNAQGTAITINWNASTGDAAGGTISYEVYVNGELKGTVTDTTYVLGEIQESVRYNIQIKAVNEVGGGTLSDYIRAYKNLNIRKGSAEDGFTYDERYSEGIYAKIDADYDSTEDYQVAYTVPSAPENAALTKEANTAIVTWDAPANDGNKPITGYYVYINGVANEVAADQAAAVALDTSAESPQYSYNFDIDSGQPYTVYVKACNSVGTGEATDLMYITPTNEAPSDLAAEVADKVNVNLTWTITNSDVTEYVLYVNGSPQTVATTDVTVDGTTVSYTFNGEINKTYNFALSAKYGTTESALSNIVSGVSTEETKAAAPQNVTVSGETGNVTLSWTAPANVDAADIDHYIVYVNGEEYKTNVAGDAVSVTIDLDYSAWIKLAAVSGYGTVGEQSKPVKFSLPEGSFGEDTPAAPTDVAYTLAITDGVLDAADNVTITWTTAPTSETHTAVADSFNIYIGQEMKENVSGNEYTFTAEAGKDYDISIEPVAGTAVGPKSSIAVEVPANEYPAPTKPELNAELNSDKTAVTLTWTAEDGVSYYLTVNGEEIAEAVTSPYEYTVLSDTTNYNFVLKAVKTYDDGGKGTAESDIVTVSTSDSGNYASAKPVITGTLSNGTTQVKVYWTAPVKGENETGDIYEYRAVIDGVEQEDSVAADAEVLVYTVDFTNVTDSKTVEIRAYKSVDSSDFIAAVSDSWVATPNCNIVVNPNDFTNNNTAGEVTNKDADGDGTADTKTPEVHIPITVNTENVNVDFVDQYGNTIKTIAPTADTDGNQKVNLPLDSTVTSDLIFNIVVKKDGYTTYTITGVPYSELGNVNIENAEIYAGDLDKNGIINSFDQNLLDNNIGKQNASPADGDLDINGVINSFDQNLLDNNMGKLSKSDTWSK